MCVHTYIHIQINRYVHIYIYIHTYVYRITITYRRIFVYLLSMYLFVHLFVCGSTFAVRAISGSRSSEQEEPPVALPRAAVRGRFVFSGGSSARPR